MSDQGRESLPQTFALPRGASPAHALLGILLLAAAFPMASCAGDAPGSGATGTAPGGASAGGAPAAAPPDRSSDSRSPSPAGEPTPQPAATDPRLEDRLEHLRALPYVQFDPGADPALSGVTVFDRDRAWPGINIHTNDEFRVYLTSLTGEILHQWQLPRPYRRCEDAELMDDGSLLVVCVDMALVRLDWESNILWELKIGVHHDVTIRPDGTILAPYHSRESYQGRQVWFDSILSAGMDGSILGTWSTIAHLDELRDHHGPSPLDEPPGPGFDPLLFSPTGVDYYHLNTVEALPDTPLGRRDTRFRAGNILISLRNANVIMVLDQESFSVLWSWGPDELELQHMPTMIDNGNILVFDNGTYRGWSRVVEVEPLSGRIVWEYRGDPPESFYSAWRGSNQRLPNGNTLICESERGRAFEVAPDGTIVWEFWNPEFKDSGRRRIYRLLRMPAERAAPFLGAAAAR